MNLEKRKYLDKDEVRKFFSAIDSGKPMSAQKKWDKKMDLLIFRLAHHGHILLFEEESYRMKHALMRQKH